MARRRPMPALVMTIAILHLVGGGLGLLGSMCIGFNLVGLLAIQGGAFPAPPVAGQPDPMAAPKFLIGNVPGYIPMEVVRLTVGLIFDLLLIVAGIGLLNGRAWARNLSIFYGGVNVLFKVFMLVYHLAYISPAARIVLEQQAAQMTNPGERQGFLIGGLYGQPCFNFFFVLYPVAVLIVMMLPATVEWFEQRGRDRGRDRDEEEDYPRRRRRAPVDEEEDAPPPRRAHAEEDEPRPRRSRRDEDEGDDRRGRFRRGDR